jgi:hypothetical protein
LIPEIIGRLPVLTYMNPLDKETLRSILTEPKNALIKQYEKLFEMDEVTLEIEEEALNYIVSKALEYKLGARGLRSLCEAILTDAMYELPSSDDKKHFSFARLFLFVWRCNILLYNSIRLNRMLIKLLLIRLILERFFSFYSCELIKRYFL